MTAIAMLSSSVAFSVWHHTHTHTNGCIYLLLKIYTYIFNFIYFRYIMNTANIWARYMLLCRKTCWITLIYIKEFENKAISALWPLWHYNSKIFTMVCFSTHFLKSEAGKPSLATSQTAASFPWKHQVVCNEGLLGLSPCTFPPQFLCTRCLVYEFKAEQKNGIVKNPTVNVDLKWALWQTRTALHTNKRAFITSCFTFTLAVRWPLSHRSWESAVAQICVQSFLSVDR